MKKKVCICFIVSALLILSAVFQASAGEYKIGKGDVLDISVWRNPDMTRQLVVLPDGTIRFPLIGELVVGGKSVGELETELKAKVKKYIPDPELSVSVRQVNSMVIYVIGKVNKPGRFEIGKDIDVLQALSVAGGLNTFAKEKQIGIYRKVNGTTKIFSFNYKAVSEGEQLEQNIMLERDDVIVVR